MRQLTRLARNLRPGDVVTLTGPDNLYTYRATVALKPYKCGPGYFSRETRYRVPLVAAPWWGDPAIVAYADTRLTIERPTVS
jgi:hypothetical protein